MKIKTAILLSLIFFSNLSAQAAPSFSLDLGDASQGASSSVQILILLTVLSVAPSILLMTTSFVRFIIVFSMLRTAMGLGQLPPTQVLVSLSLILTFIVMQPTFNRINEEALQPFLTNQIDEKKFFELGSKPLKDFMIHQAGPREIEVTYRIASTEKPDSIDQVPFHIVVVSFMLSELKKAFQIGFMLFLPFLIIDLIVGSALVSVGLMFLPPATVALPFKVVLFILIDGWNILCEGLVRGINPL